MVNLEGFNADKVDPEGLDAIPAAIYTMAITKSEQKQNKKGDGWYLNVQLQVLEGPYKGRIVFCILNLGNKNETAKMLAQSQLSQICRAVNIRQPKDSSQLHNIPMAVEIGHVKYQDRLKNEAVKFMPAGTRAVSGAASVATEDTPWG